MCPEVAPQSSPPQLGACYGVRTQCSIQVTAQSATMNFLGPNGSSKKQTRARRELCLEFAGCVRICVFSSGDGRVRSGADFCMARSQVLPSWLELFPECEVISFVISKTPTFLNVVKMLTMAITVNSRAFYFEMRILLQFIQDIFLFRPQGYLGTH